MAEDRLLQKIRFQMLGAYRQASLWLGHFYLFITIWRALFRLGPGRPILILESLLACATFYGIAAFIRPMAKALGHLENIAFLMFLVILANNTVLVAVLRAPGAISLFMLTQVMAGAALRSRARFLVLEAVTVAVWGFACHRWLPGPWSENFDFFMVLSGLLSGSILFGFIGNLVGSLTRLRAKDHQLLTQRSALVHDLQEALASVRTLRGIIPICSYCHKVRNDEGYWNQVETYLASHSDARFSHGICPQCMAPLQAEMDAMKAAEGLRFEQS